MENNYEKLITLKEASVLFGIHYRKLLYAVNSGLLPHYPDGKLKKVRASEIEGFLQKIRLGGNHAN